MIKALQSIMKSLHFLKNHDLALLLLRIFTGSALFIQHGVEKLFGFNQMLEIFPNPLYIGKLPSLIFALFTDGILSIFIIFGIFTRLSSTFICINLIVAFFVFHKANFEEGEVAFIYLGIMLSLFLSGAGKYSIDKKYKRQ
ncbi:DoxX family protein [Aquimarina sp. M1]